MSDKVFRAIAMGVVLSAAVMYVGYIGYVIKKYF